MEVCLVVQGQRRISSGLDKFEEACRLESEW